MEKCLHESVSAPFTEKQGIRQGGSSSADKYKAGKNRLLHQLHKHPSNRIGYLPVGAIMVADDLVITSNKAYKQQTSLNIAAHDASKDRYKFNVDKTKTVTLNSNSSPTFILNNKPLGTSSAEPHLGIVRNEEGDNSTTVEDRIKSARRVTFSLLGAGYYGVNGVGPNVAAFQYKAYVSPTMLYGLEAIVPTDEDIKKLEQAHRKSLRRIQGLPDSSANPAIYLLIGILPVEAMIHVRALTLFRSILAAETPSPPAMFIKELILRQLAMKDNTSKSWTVYIKQLLQRYNLPEPSLLTKETPTKKKWSKMVKTSVTESWKRILAEAGCPREEDAGSAQRRNVLSGLCPSSVE